MIKKFIKNWIILNIFLFYPTIIFAASLKQQAIPQDSNVRPYSAIIGQDANGQWQILTLKELSSGKYSFDLGTLSAQVIGSIDTILSINEPVWEAQPGLRYINLDNVELLPFGSYTVTQTITGVGNFEVFLEYLVIVRNEKKLIDYFNFQLYVNRLYTEEAIYLVLGGEITPSNPINIFKPPIPILIGEFLSSKMKLVLQNKVDDIQKLNIGIIISYRKSNYAP